MAVCNCNVVVAVCRSWQLPLVNIGGIDIAQGRRMATLSLVGEGCGGRKSVGCFACWVQGCMCTL